MHRLLCSAILLTVATAAVPQTRFTRMTGGPGSHDPTHFTCENCTLALIVCEAFGIRNFQLTGPRFLSEQRVDLTVPIPPGATKEQYRQILLSLLETRLGMVWHRETKTIPAFDLIAVDEAKLTPAAHAGADPFGIIPAPERGRGRLEFSSGPQGSRLDVIETLDAFAARLSKQIDRPVNNATGRDGKFEFRLWWNLTPGPVPAAAGPSLEEALRTQLGLNLSPAARPTEVVVIDRIAKRLKR